MGFYEWDQNRRKKLAKLIRRKVFGCADMQGPFPLLRSVILPAVANAPCGNYRLSKSDLGETFVVDYVGRSDTQLAERIADHINENEYKTFVFCAKLTPGSAYRQECSDFHDFGGDIGLLENDPVLGHPHAPEGESLQCPVCGA